MRVLIVADNASSKFGGEAFLPFNYFRLLRERNFDVRLLVHERNRVELSSQFPADRDRFYFVPDTNVHRAASRVGMMLPRRIAEATTGMIIHLSTQQAQRRVIRELLKAHQFDVIHIPIPVSPKSPSLFYDLGVPVVFGPMNGGMEYPPSLRSEEYLISRFAVSLGRYLADFVNQIIPGKRRARLLLVANSRTRDALPKGIRGRVLDLVENGVDFQVWRRDSRAKINSVLQLVFIGRLVDWKALEIVIESIHRLQRSPAVRLEIVGDGPMRANWEKLARDRGLQNVVTFSGWLNQQDCADRLRRADVFVLPSLFESGGAAVLEAMAMGLPVIATAWGGPLDYLDQSCGILISPTSREALVAGFSLAIKDLAHSAELRQRLGEAGYQKAVQLFDWDKKIEAMIELYNLALKPS